MKCSEVKITLNPDDARRAASARLCNVEDEGITTAAQAEAYQGAVFTENPVDCINLHLVYRDGLACVNFVNEEGIRVNYDYPIHSLKRISHKANEFHSVKH
ncbi:hypothetical protein VPHD530_0034 [Vibrio phage D530]